MSSRPPISRLVYILVLQQRPTNVSRVLQLLPRNNIVIAIVCTRKKTLFNHNILQFVSSINHT